jgi:hypothetical protein
VAPSPSRFKCVTPLRPSAQGSASAPQRTSPRCGVRGDENTVIGLEKLADPDFTLLLRMPIPLADAADMEERLPLA